MLAEAGKLSGPEEVGNDRAASCKSSPSAAKSAAPISRSWSCCGGRSSSAGGRDTEVNTFEEAVALGKAAAANSDWQQALDAYRKAIELAEKTKLRNPTGIAEAREAIDRVQLMLARDAVQCQGKFNECMALAGKIVCDEQGNVKSQAPTAAQASALGVSAVLNHTWPPRKTRSPPRWNA